MEDTEEKQQAALVRNSTEKLPLVSKAKELLNFL